MVMLLVPVQRRHGNGCASRLPLSSKESLLSGYEDDTRHTLHLNLNLRFFRFGFRAVGANFIKLPVSHQTAGRRLVSPKTAGRPWFSHWRSSAPTHPSPGSHCVFAAGSARYAHGSCAELNALMELTKWDSRGKFSRLSSAKLPGLMLRLQRPRYRIGQLKQETGLFTWNLLSF